MKRAAGTVTMLVFAVIPACTPLQPPAPRPATLTSADILTAELDGAAVAELDNARIATIAITISNGQDVRARIAERLAHDPRVLGFAEHILSTLPGPSSTIATMKFAPRSSVLGDELTRATQGAVDDLDLRRGNDFDREFLASEGRSLLAALRLLDTALIPRASNAQLGEELGWMRTVLTRDLSDLDAVARVVSLEW